MCDLAELMEFAEAYSALGSAVQEQLYDLLSGNTQTVNPNAVTEIMNSLDGFSDELDEIPEEYFADKTEA